MKEYPRDVFKIDPVMHKLYMLIKSNHKVADHTEKVLLDNCYIKDFCEEARHFWFIPVKDKEPIYLHYDVSSWFKAPMGVVVKIDSIGIYDDFMEYETARLKGLHSGRKADIPNIN